MAFKSAPAAERQNDLWGQTSQRRRSVLVKHFRPAKASKQGGLKRLFLSDHNSHSEKKRIYRERAIQGQNSSVSRRGSAVKSGQDNSLPLLKRRFGTCWRQSAFEDV